MIRSRRPRPIGAPRPSGTARPISTTRCSTPPAGCGSPRGSVRQTTRRSARPDRIKPRPGCSRCNGPDDRRRCTIQERKCSRCSTCASRRIICSSRATPTTRCGSAAAAPATWSAGSIPKCSMPPAMCRSRRAGPPLFSTRTATASATTMSSPTSRSIRTRTSASWPACTGSLPARSTGRSGDPCSAIRDLSCGSIQDRTRRRPRCPRSMNRRPARTRRAAWTSTAKASSGHRWQAGNSPASTGRNARGRSTGPRRPASIAPKDGRSIRIRDRSSKA